MLGPDRRDAQVDATTAHYGDGLLDLLGFGRAQIVKIGRDSGDRPLNSGDFLGGRQGFSLCPVVGVDSCSEDAFTVAQQVGEVCLQVR